MQTRSQWLHMKGEGVQAQRFSLRLASITRGLPLESHGKENWQKNVQYARIFSCRRHKRGRRSPPENDDSQKPATDRKRGQSQKVKQGKIQAHTQQVSHMHRQMVCQARLVELMLNR